MGSLTQTRLASFVHSKTARLGLAGILCVLLAMCGVRVESTAVIEQTPLSSTSAECSGQFVEHPLPHITAENVERIGFFFSNGAGLAINDLDNDGDQDIVLGNLLGDNQLFWNEGNWQFRAETLFNGSTRAVLAVDLDGDSWLDIVTASRNGTIRHWRNLGDGQFSEEKLVGIQALAYVIDSADLDNDGDLDLVTASYDASLQKQMGDNYTMSNQNGVFVHLQNDGVFESQRLSNEAQALALQLADLDGDQRLDLVVGNDFDMRDAIWLQQDGGWVSAEPFAQTSMATMSFATGDIENSGNSVLFSADMHPYSDAPEIMAQWQPVMDAMHMEMMPDDPQTMENVLQIPDGAGAFVNDAVDRGLWATGWSWSGKFGDLDQDGFLDFYVVNGMQALDNFSHLPNDELVEENQAFRNDGRGHFDLIGDRWRLNSTAGGRSMSMADIDGDGDLDIVVNNLGVPSVIYENQLCEGNSLLVDLRMPRHRNTKALGATATLKTTHGTLTRQVTASSGYLSADSSTLHFGLPDGVEAESLVIQWPDGVETVVGSAEINHHIIVTR